MTGSYGKIEVDLTAGANFRYLPMHDVITDPKQYMELSWDGLFNFWKGLARGASITDEQLINNYVNPKLWNSSEGGMVPQYNLWNIPNIINNDGTFNNEAQMKYTPESWYDNMFHTGIKSGVGVRISGGSDKTTYYTSANFLNDEGYYIQSNFRRLTTLSNLDYSPKKWLTANFKMQYSYSTMNNVGQSSRDANNGFSFVNSIPPMIEIGRASCRERV